MLHYAIFRATCFATAKSALLQLHEQRCYTLQCFLQLVSQLVPLGTRLRLNCWKRIFIGWLHKTLRDKLLHSAMLQSAIVAKSRTWFYFVQRLLQQKCCETWWLRGMLHNAISRATCVATKLFIEHSSDGPKTCNYMSANECNQEFYSYKCRSCDLAWWAGWTASL